MGLDEAFLNFFLAFDLPSPPLRLTMGVIAKLGSSQSGAYVHEL